MADLRGRHSDFEEEVGVIAVAVGHAFDDFDLVIDSFQEAGVKGELAVSQDAGEDFAERAFAGAVLADQRMAKAALNGERDIVQGEDAGEAFGDVFEFKP